MKLFLVIFAVIAAVAADVSHLPSNEYLPPGQEPVAAAPANDYLPPVQQQAAPSAVVEEAAPAHELADDGYRYKTQRRVVYRRNRRDASHVASNEYLPPNQEAQVLESAPVEQYAVAAEESAPAHELADDGYRYKTQRRVVYRRNRRDVSHLPTNTYLPPGQQQQADAAVPAPAYQAAPATEIVEEPIVVNVQEEAEPAHELADDGYRYKTHRRVVYRRNRRDASHLISNEYLPPGQQAAAAAPAPVYQAAPVAAPSNDYLPPVQQQAAPTAVVEEVAPAHELADDGYRYKTHRRVVYRRNRRDVSHLASNEYLPPNQEAQVLESAPVEQYAAAVEESAPAHELADDGYRYKTQRRVVYRRNRRDASHVASNEYLPPNQEAQVLESAPVEQYAAAVEETAPAHELADDGYRYKTQRRVVYRRNRRDASHVASNEYLPPNQEAQVLESAPVEQYAVAAEESAPAHELADDGYRYKTQRRVVYRRNRRDVSHLPSNEYLPPVEAASAPSNEYLPPTQVQQDAAPAHELADDGYRYKTHRRVVYRRH